VTGDHALTVLVVEDDRSLRDGLRFNLERKGLEVLAAADGDEGLRLAMAASPDLIVLDLMLPGTSGLDILRAMREHDRRTQVLILSARDRTDHKIEGLELGADDYVTKPFDLRELMARVDVMLRRCGRERSEEPDIRFGDVVVDPAGHKVTRRGREVGLSRREFDLLVLLARSPGRTYTRDVILDRVWGWGFEGTTRTVDNFIVSLRQKLEPDPNAPRYIRTVRGVGYRFELDGQ
jgi:DNA-binding response OmpR family regulator